MNADLYAPPRAVLETPHNDPAMPRGMRWQIMSGFYTAAVSGAATLFHALRLFGSETPLVYLVYGVSAAVVILGLGYGTYRGGRTCAVLALLTFLLMRGLLLSRYGVHPGWPVALIMLGCYTLGVIGTFRWHAYRDAHRRATSPAI